MDLLALDEALSKFERDDPDSGRAGQAALFRRADDRRSGRRSGDLRPQLLTAIGLTPGPGCMRSCEGDRSRHAKTDLAIF